MENRMLTEKEKEKFIKELARACMVWNFTTPFRNLTWYKILREKISIDRKELKFDEDFTLTKENIAALRDAARADGILQCIILAIIGSLIGLILPQFLGI